MSLFLASFLPGLFLIAMGALLLVSNSLIVSTLKALPRSPVATAVLWGGASIWFLYVLWNLSPADLVVFESSKPLVLIFGVIALAAFYYVPDFLAVRGASALTLLAAWEILMGSFGEYGALLFMKAIVIIAVVIAIYLACVPYRARDILQWLYNRAQRARILGTVAAVCGLLIVVIAFCH